jgi:hypothetical protein
MMSARRARRLPPACDGVTLEDSIRLNDESVHVCLARRHSAWFVVPRESLARIHLPASLRSTPVTALPGYYGGSDFRHPAPLHVADLPDSHRSGFRPFCLQTPDDLPPSLSHALLSAADFPLGPFPVCVHRVWGFAIEPQARQIIRSNRVPLVRTGRSPSVALHPALRRRSYGRLWSMSV